MALKLTKTVMEFLQARPEQAFTARQIANWIFETKPEECAAKKEKSQSVTNDKELLGQIVAEIGSQYPILKKHVPQIKTTQGRPRKYYYSDKSDEDEISEAESTPSKTAEQDKLTEHKLYPLLSDYLWSQHHLYSKRIDEKKSSNKKGTNGNKWLYPDLVAMENLSYDWNTEVRDCVAGQKHERFLNAKTVKKRVQSDALPIFLMSAKALFSKFTSFTDKRDPKKSTHILAEVMFMSVCAILCGADDWNSIRLFAEHKEDWFRKHLTLPAEFR